MQRTPPIPRLTDWLPLLRDTLAREGRFTWRVEGKSMLPTLLPGCEIEVVPAAPPLRRGEVVVFVARNELVVHRLTRRIEDRWIAQGDGLPIPDTALTEREIVGRVRRATYQEQQLWPPKHFARSVVFFWLFRYHALRVKRFLQRLTVGWAG